MTLLLFIIIISVPVSGPFTSILAGDIICKFVARDNKMGLQSISSLEGQKVSTTSQFHIGYSVFLYLPAGDSICKGLLLYSGIMTHYGNEPRTFALL